jgi:DNA ligase-1
MLRYKPQNAKKTDSVEQAAARCERPILEAKLDGWRLLVEVTGDGVHVYSRTNHRYDGRLPEIEAELEKLPPGTILDGEIVSLSDQDCTAVTNVLGKSVTQTIKQQREKLTYVVFDILEVAGVDARNNVLEDRIRVLRRAFERCEINKSLVTSVVQQPCEEAAYLTLIASGHEGVIVKDLAKPYASGKRGHGWFKIKATVEVDMVVMALPIDGKGQFEGQVGRMVLGQYVDGELAERAKVKCPDNVTHRAATDRPQDFLGRVCSIKHYGLTQATGSEEITFRHPTFVRWREDKPAVDCVYDNG